MNQIHQRGETGQGEHVRRFSTARWISGSADAVRGFAIGPWPKVRGAWPTSSMGRMLGSSSPPPGRRCQVPRGWHLFAGHLFAGPLRVWRVVGDVPTFVRISARGLRYRPDVIEVWGEIRLLPA